MSIEDSQNLFFATFHHILFSERSGPGPLGPVGKILVVGPVRKDLNLLGPLEHYKLQ